MKNSEKEVQVDENLSYNSSKQLTYSYQLADFPNMCSASLIKKYLNDFQILNIVAMLVVKLRVVGSSLNSGRQLIADICNKERFSLDV